MTKESTTHPSWVTRGKNIRQLIKELQSFENQDLLVEISLDGGSTHKPISLVAKECLDELRNQSRTFRQTTLV